MKITCETYPWKYYTVDNFFTHDELEQIEQKLNPWLEKHDYKNRLVNTEKFSHAGFRADRHFKNDEIPSGVYDAHTRMLEAVGWQPPADSEPFLQMQFSVMGNRMSYPVHSDVVEKLTSTVVYLGDDGNGTLLYETKNGPVVREAEWRHNRAMYFERTDDTWHAYHNIRDHVRITIILNMMIEKT